MLELYIPGYEVYDENLNEFGFVQGETLRLEYSLIAISKWESKFKVPFLTKKEFTKLEFLYFVECMTINRPKDLRIYSNLNSEKIDKIKDYMNDTYTATTIKRDNVKPSRDVLTSELIYYYMVAGEIPFECEKWHLNRLMTLIEIVSIKNQPPKKMSKSQLAKHNTSLNAARLKSMRTKG